MSLEKLFENKIDACVILTEANRLYVTGLSTSHGCVVVFPDKKYFFTDARYEVVARERLEGFEVIRGWLKEVKELLSTRKIKYLGIEESISHLDYKGYKALFSDYTLKDISLKLAQIRSIKTPEEIELIAASQALNEQALKSSLKYIKAGATEREIAAEIMYHSLLLGADSAAFSGIIAVGENSAKPHCTPSNREIEKGEHVMIDIGARLNGYCSDMTRCFCVGSPSKDILKMYNDVLAAQEYALSNIKAGITTGEADSFAREFLLSRGYSSEFSHSLGHGVGVDIHEIPTVSQNGETILEENMVITIEPGVYIEGVGGVRIEDLVVVTKSGVRNLTTFSKEFII